MTLLPARGISIALICFPSLVLGASGFALTKSQSQTPQRGRVRQNPNWHLTFAQ